MNQSNDLGRFNDYPDVSHLNESIKGTAGYDLIQWPIGLNYQKCWFRRRMAI